MSSQLEAAKTNSSVALDLGLQNRSPCHQHTVPFEKKPICKVYSAMDENIERKS